MLPLLLANFVLLYLLGPTKMSTLLLILMPAIYLHIFTTLRHQQKAYEMAEKESILQVQVTNMTSRMEEYIEAELATVFANALKNAIHGCENNHADYEFKAGEEYFPLRVSFH